MPYCTAANATTFAPLLSDTMVEFAVDLNAARQAAFLAQVAHESAELRYREEIASGDAYEGRRDLGNTQPGDGPRFKGRGLIQITGRTNYAACSLALYGDDTLLLNEPELLEEPQAAADSAGWFWSSHGLNAFADVGDFETISVRINGRNRATGMPNGYDQRVAYWRAFQSVLGGR
jgi:putative chitinase